MLRSRLFKLITMAAGALAGGLALAPPSAAITVPVPCTLEGEFIFKDDPITGARIEQLRAYGICATRGMVWLEGDQLYPWGIHVGDHQIYVGGPCASSLEPSLGMSGPTEFTIPDARLIDVHADAWPVKLEGYFGPYAVEMTGAGENVGLTAVYQVLARRTGDECHIEIHGTMTVAWPFS